MAKFSMNDLLNSQSKKTGEQVKSGFAIQQIPIEKIMPSQSNKYGIRDIEEMAANIETMGLLHNLVVRESGNGLYELVSGERRYRGMKLLFNGGNTDYATVPCKVESGKSEAFTELELLFANSTARELTDYEKTYQAGRIKELLQELKKSGYKFSGRMREIAADILKVSPAQMGRMESINKNLAPEFVEEFKSERISVTAAYELSALPQEEQEKALAGYKHSGDIDIKAVKEQRERVKPSTATPTVPPAARTHTNEETTPAAILPPTATTPTKREAVIQELYIAAGDLYGRGGSNNERIAETCRAAAALLADRG